ncbi:DUF4397 domain-containing protein [Haloarchaeobius amylolyticus]|uniref:DUF4397 domain-containing protein n=1 Tax=Haloarchaeobius amylolyticus TaxID=1198296 RepID=UPI0022711995|nr:DUF4397 domain-containing protein [Haloarchaeobius amylolyticus]
MTTRRTVLKTVGIVGGTAALGGWPVAAQADDDQFPFDDDDVATAAADPVAARVFHAVPDGPALDLLVNDYEVLEGFGYGRITPYAELRPGLFDFRTILDVQTFAPGIVEGPEDTLRLREGDYTIVVAGPSLPSDDAQLLVFEDDNTPVPRNRARVRIVHVSPDAGAVNVGAQGVGRLARRLEFGEATDYETVPAGMLELTLRKPGGQGSLDVLLALAGGATYTVFAHGFLFDETGALSIGGDRGFKLLPVADDLTASQRVSLTSIPPLRRRRRRPPWYGRGGYGRGGYWRGGYWRGDDGRGGYWGDDFWDDYWSGGYGGGGGGWQRRRRRGVHSPRGRGPAPGDDFQSPWQTGDT